MDLSKIIYELIFALSTVYVALFMSVKNFNKHGRSMKIVAGYIVITSLVQLGATYLASINIANLPLVHVHTIVEFAFITFFFIEEFKNFVHKNIMIAILCIFSVLSILNSIFIQDIFQFNTYSRSLEGILVISFCLLWFYKISIELNITRLEEEPAFWVNAGFLLYFSGSVLLFAFSNYILSFNHDLNVYIWAFHSLFANLLYLSISIGLWKVPRTTK